MSDRKSKQPVPFGTKVYRVLEGRLDVGEVQEYITSAGLQSIGSYLTPREAWQAHAELLELQLGPARRHVEQLEAELEKAQRRRYEIAGRRNKAQDEVRRIDAAQLREALAEAERAARAADPRPRLSCGCLREDANTDMPYPVCSTPCPHNRIWDVEDNVEREGVCEDHAQDYRYD